MAQAARASAQANMRIRDMVATDTGVRTRLRWRWLVGVGFSPVSATIAPDDIVQTTADAQGNSRPPLLVLEPLRDFLDAHSLGSGEVEASPVGEGHSNVTYLIRRGDTDLVLRRPPRP